MSACNISNASSLPQLASSIDAIAIINSPLGSRTLMRHAIKELNEENLSFFIDAASYANEADPLERRRRLARIVRTYILSGAPLQLNCSAKVADALIAFVTGTSVVNPSTVELADQAPPDVLHSLQCDVYETVKSETFRRLKLSPQWSRLLDSFVINFFAPPASLPVAVPNQVTPDSQANDHSVAPILAAAAASVAHRKSISFAQTSPDQGVALPVEKSTDLAVSLLLNDGNERFCMLGHDAALCSSVETQQLTLWQNPLVAECFRIFLQRSPSEAIRSCLPALSAIETFSRSAQPITSRLVEAKRIMTELFATQSAIASSAIINAEVIEELNKTIDSSSDVSRNVFDSVALKIRKHLITVCWTDFESSAEFKLLRARWETLCSHQHVNLNAPLTPVAGSAKSVAPAVSLQDVISEPRYLSRYLNFCVREHSEEVILFLLAVNEYEKQPSAVIAQNIVHKFIRPGSQLEIPAAGAAKNEVMAGASSGDPSLFHAIREVCESIARADSLQRFLASAEFARAQAFHQAMDESRPVHDDEPATECCCCFGSSSVTPAQPKQAFQ
jgi:hypothetical protein